MRFYFGLSKRISLKSLLKWGALIISGLLAFFGINNITALAGTLETFQYFSSCSYQTTSYNSSNCTQLSGNVVTKTSMNGLANVFTPTGYYSQNYSFSQTASKRSSLFKWEGASSSTPCSTSGTLSYYVDVIMGDKNNSFARNVLDPNNTEPNNPNPPIITSMREGVRRIMASSSCTSTWCYYWSWLSSTNTNTNNQTGVRTIKADGTSLSNCTYISRDDSHRSARFRCSVATSGNGGTGHILIIDQYNNGYDGLTAQNYNNVGLYAPIGIKVTKISDPCSSDNNSVTSSINDQTNEIIQGFSDIQNDINDFKNQNHQDLEDVKDWSSSIDGKLDDVKDKQDDTNDKLDDIKDGINEVDKNTTSCKEDTFNKDNNPYNSNIGFLYGNGLISNNNDYRYTDYLSLGNKTNIIIKSNSNIGTGTSFCLYSRDKSVISCTSYSSNTNFSINNSNAYYIRLTYRVASDLPFTIVLKRCSGIGQTLSDYYNDEGIGDSFVPEGLQDITNLIDNEPQVVQDLIQLPVKFLRTIYDNVNSNSCSAYTVDIPFFDGKTYHWNFTCPNYNELIGETPTTIIDAIICFILIFGIAKMGVRVYEDISSAKDTFDEIYKGGH